MSRYLTRRCQATLIASAAVLAVMAAGPASACVRYPVVPDTAKLVRGTNAIVLARVIGITMRRDKAEYRFKVLKVLKGHAVGRFVRTERTEGRPRTPRRARRDSPAV